MNQKSKSDDGCMGCVVVGSLLLFGFMLVCFIGNFASDQYDSFKLWMRTSKKIPISATQVPNFMI